MRHFPLLARSLAQSLVLWLVLWLALGGGPAAADQALARSRLCLGCHDVERKLVGPALRDVAARYAGQSNALPKLADKILNGGKGDWGPVPMPANPRVTPAEARQLAAWVMSLK